MGADGGTIAKRQDLLSSLTNRANADAQRGEDKEEDLIKICHLSSLPLYNNDPIVGDYKGKLYIKEKLLQYLLDIKMNKSSIKSEFSHIKSLKDICPVTVSWTIINREPFIECPVIKKVEKSYLYLRSCGCLISKKALNELSETKEERKCPNCNVIFYDYDIVMLDPLNLKQNRDINEENISILKQKGLSHSKLPLKKTKKKKLLDEDEYIRKRKLPDEITNSRKRKPTVS
ncbi:conserved hypothetical protein [Candida dubliniensis CD36]|uniref:Replication termination factor 2 n=1 Tax=Candida dubliniensis (strain CD36 / ATCC MYA-646 / CBS 7987 / NCPF 3949 / NRRL Y-17841) TaxID=573826 RepID=B9W7Z1_CANDC|nr:conserved hypothetical protein [Candida dubliniensis CD36]CAX44804.1 conserved hypothetical protein [Candida dubliniensis CD36]